MKVAPNTITGSKIRSITHLAKVVVAREDIVFNYQKEKFNLKNGKIDIETTKFEKRTETDYCTICTDYDYDKDAKTEEIEKFLFDIANGDSRRIRLLKQLMGYCLTKDIEYHKAFILYGKGRNGKSVFLQMLTDMVGEKNVANIPIHGLDDAFQLINIRNKMINISTEVNADKNDGTDVFKKVVAGDPVMACKKNKDFIEFKPFAKLIFATNKIMTARETTDGYMDRLIIIDFQSKYVTNPNPQKPHEKKIIENYYDKYIKNNITGALIVALDGLIDLSTEGGFYETLENKQHKEDIKRTANPIYAFVYDKNLIDKERSLEDLYETYAAWCSVSGSGRMSMRRFQMELQETFNFRKLENISYIPGEKELWKITD
jgi:putative DNA primase/helicase